MGYESKIFVVNKSDWMKDNYGHYYGRIIAMVDMSCCLGLSNLFRTPANVYIYAENPDEPVCDDRYGEELKCGDIQEIIEWCEAEYNKEHYRRFSPLIGLLKGFDREEWNNLQVIHYGH